LRASKVLKYETLPVNKNDVALKAEELVYAV
jgi:hypothetical protein